MTWELVRKDERNDEKGSLASLEHVPKHIAITMHGTLSYAKEHTISLAKACDDELKKIKEIVEHLIRKGIPIMTFMVASERSIQSENFALRMEALHSFLEGLRNWEFIKEQQIKVTVIGKWYSLPSRIIEPIKNIVSDTKEHDSSYLNLCINYDGKTEIVDACQIIGRKIKAEKIEPESITKEMIKENLYTSYFTAPDLIIKTGKIARLYGFLMWDSSESIIHFCKKRWLEIEQKDIDSAMIEYQEYASSREQKE